jgi:hypothetical protein
MDRLYAWHQQAVDHPVYYSSYYFDDKTFEVVSGEP